MLNRRRFLQALGAAGIAPALPTLSTGAASAPSTATPAQLLWKGIYAKAGTAPIDRAVQVTGISPKAACGIYAKLVSNKVVAAHSAARLGQVAPKPVPRASGVPVSKAALSSKPAPAQMARVKPLRIDVKKLLRDPSEQNPQDQNPPDQTPQDPEPLERP